MWTVDIPGFKKLKIQHLVFDFNGTLAIEGKLIKGVAEKLEELSKLFTLHVITADTFGQAASELKDVAVSLTVIQDNGQAKIKQQFIENLSAENVIAFGNGRNDRLMLKSAAIGILVLQKEGCFTESIQLADVVANNIIDATELILHPKRLIATLRD
ncbi:MAG: HAD hydrolase family protein [Bacteroidales bacterium]|nr:HAD hydrolase family protein [Bacteroidales bacterium]